MASNGHAKLGPSAAKRWMTCPGSTRLLEAIPDLGSQPAAEGTLCHWALARRLTEGLMLAFDTYMVENDGAVHRASGMVAFAGRQVEAGRVVLYTEEMADWVEQASRWVRQYIFAHPSARLLVETRSPVGHAFGCSDELWGTADIVLVNDEEHELVVADAKFGFEEVEGKDNPQVSLYAIGMLDLLGWEHFDNVELVILQPQSPEPVKEELLTIEEMRNRKRSYEEPVRRAVQWTTADLVASDDACRWCRAMAVCPEARRRAERLAGEEFAEPELLKPEEVLRVLQDREVIRRHLKAVEEWALQQLALGQSVSGWKRVESNKHRQWKDVKEAEFALALVADEKQYMTTPELKSPAQVEKSLKLPAGLLDELAPKPKGDPTLAPEDDPRPALAPDFEQA